MSAEPLSDEELALIEARAAAPKMHRAHRQDVAALVAEVRSLRALRESVSPRPWALLEAAQERLDRANIELAEMREKFAAVDAVGVSPPSPDAQTENLAVGVPEAPPRPNAMKPQ